MDIDSGNTKINICVMVRDGKREKRWLEWRWRCREAMDRAKKRGEKRKNNEREKVERDRNFTTDK